MKKGTNSEYECYSGFGCEGENTFLLKLLKEREIEKVYVCGLALDYCVRCTAMDAKKYGFDTYLLLEGTRGIDKQKCHAVLEEL